MNPDFKMVENYLVESTCGICGRLGPFDIMFAVYCFGIFSQGFCFIQLCICMASGLKMLQVQAVYSILFFMDFTYIVQKTKHIVFK